MVLSLLLIIGSNVIPIYLIQCRLRKCPYWYLGVPDGSGGNLLVGGLCRRGSVTAGSCCYLLASLVLLLAADSSRLLLLWHFKIYNSDHWSLPSVETGLLFDSRPFFQSKRDFTILLLQVTVSFLEDSGSLPPLPPLMQAK